MAAKGFLLLAEISVCVLPIRYVETPAGNYSAGGYEIVSYASVAVYLVLCGLLLLIYWKQICPKKKAAPGQKSIFLSLLISTTMV